MNRQATLTPDAIQSKKDTVSAEEWQLRVDLAAAYRLIALHGWDDLIFTHLSARIPGDEHHFLINPYGMMFDEITASSLVRVDQVGNKLDDSDFDINPACFRWPAWPTTTTKAWHCAKTKRPACRQTWATPTS